VQKARNDKGEDCHGFPKGSLSMTVHPIVIAGMGKGFGKGKGIKVEIAIGNKIENLF